jgi:hypothetical protein
MHPHPTSPLPFWQRAFILFAVGAIGGSLGDFFHVLSETTGYPPGWIRVPGLGLPIWVPVLFGTAGLGIGLSHPWLDQKLDPLKPLQRPGLVSPLRIGAALLLMLFTWIASGYLPLATGGSKDFVIAACAAAIWWGFDRTASGLRLAILTAALGTLVEVVQVRFIENFYYVPPATNLGGVPSWLPLLYVSASIALGNFGRWLAGGLTPSRPSESPAT